MLAAIWRSHDGLGARASRRVAQGVIEMHILLIAIIVMGLATILLIGWAQGQLFACVFLSIPTGLSMLIFAMQEPVRSPDHVFWASVLFRVAGRHLGAPRVRTGRRLYYRRGPRKAVQEQHS